MGTKVVILKSESYRHESLDLFKKIIENRRLDVKVVDSTDDNNIDLDFLDSNLEWLMAP
jgi:hypothetical protein